MSMDVDAFLRVYNAVGILHPEMPVIEDIDFVLFIIDHRNLLLYCGIVFFTLAFLTKALFIKKQKEIIEKKANNTKKEKVNKDKKES
jgi:phosphotransferase system  glucose/maltose/N-acetylglucosamine-specific IIC component